jgi:HEAT repeat protein
MARYQFCPEPVRSFIGLGACAIVLAALVAPALQAQDQTAESRSLEKRLKALEDKLDAALRVWQTGGALPPAGALYDGEPAAYWIRLLADRNDEASAAALRALDGLGEAAADRLLEAVGADDWFVRRNAVTVLGRLAERGGERAAKAVVEGARDRDARVRCAAVDAAAGALAKAARDRIALVEDARTIDRDIPALEAYFRALEASVPPAIVTAMNDGDLRVRIRAARGIAELALKDDAAVQGLRGRLGDAEPLVRREAAFALAGLDIKASGDAVPVLVELLKAKTEEMKASRAAPSSLSRQAVNAIQVLGSLGSKAASAVPALQALRDVEVAAPAVRGAASTGKRGVVRGGLRPASPYRSEIERALRAIEGDAESVD